jgi:hypothetical protein
VEGDECAGLAFSGARLGLLAAAAPKAQPRAGGPGLLFVHKREDAGGILQRARARPK